ncbi:uncharacterized protein LOC116679190 isoform X2 [Etheostoma spectabile]|nr:uncharacterized protein LOC116679190 isoform X2 [Etheostoma spectabile]XP_032364777.1 uncharacterized protein LOC116679190 isoform X2 [Etheostoma spectabile]XP_032364778.1 uncharacterized protein LOC116679190 isoform X2 [Etheostoma spectabile]
MSQCEDREEGVHPPKPPLWGDHDSQTKAQSPETQHGPGPGPRPTPGPGPGPRPGSGPAPAPDPRPESSCLSFKSDHSKGFFVTFKHEHEKIPQGPDCPGPGPSCVSMKSDWSMSQPLDFKDGRHSAAQRVDQESSEGPSGPSAQQHQTHLDSIFMLLEDDIVTFVKNELKKIQKVLSPDYPKSFESQRKDEEVLDGEDEEQRKSSREAFLKITLHFLRRMKQEELADRLQSRSYHGVCKRKLKSNQQKTFQCMFEGIAKAGNPTVLYQMFTEIYLMEGGLQRSMMN